MAGLGCCVCFSLVSKWTGNSTTAVPSATSSRMIAFSVVHCGGKYLEHLWNKPFSDSSEWEKEKVYKGSWNFDFRYKKMKQLLALNSRYEAVLVDLGAFQRLSEEGQVDKAVDVLYSMDQQGTAPSVQMYRTLLKACSKRKALFQTRQVCAHVAKNGMESTGLLGEYLVCTLVNCGSLADALVVFDRQACRTALSWTAMISGYTRAGQAKRALNFFQRMQQENVQPNTSTFVSLLKACTAIADLEQCKHIHAEVLKHRCKSDLSLQTCLIHMYAKCGSIEEAQGVFDRLPQRDVVTWTVLLTAYVHRGQVNEALQLYQQMYEESACPNARTFMSLLQVICVLAEKEEEVHLDGRPTKLESLWKGKAIHAHSHRNGSDGDSYLGNTLVSMYGKCGSIVDAETVFDSLLQCDVVSWNAMLAAYADQAQAENVLQLYGQMLEEFVSPNDRTFVTLLQACGMLAEKEESTVVNGQHAKAKSLGMGKAIHFDARKKGYDADVFVGNTLISIYGKCGSIVDAHNVFVDLQKRNVVSWNAILSAHVLHGQPETVMQLYGHMVEEHGSFNDRSTVVSLLQACTMMAETEEAFFLDRQFVKVKSFQLGRAVHADSWRHGYNADVFVGSSLISLYGKCGSTLDAEYVFEGLGEQNVVSWSAMVCAYSQQSQVAKALKLYEVMQEQGYCPNDRTFVGALQACSMLADEEEYSRTDELSMKIQALVTGKAIHAQAWRNGYQSDVFVGSALIIMYGKCGTIRDAQNVFDGLSSHSLVAWNAMLSAHLEQGQGDSALQLYKDMQKQRFKPNEITIACALQVCSYTGSLDDCRQIHHSLVSTGPDLCSFLTNCLIHAYGRSGSMVDAQAVFDTMQQPDVVSWTALIAGYAWQGNCVGSLQCYDKMLLAGVEPNEVTFLALLSACSHSGLVDSGVEYFESMIRNYGITPQIEHYVSIVDLLGRAGCFERIEHLLQTMPVPPSLSLWLCLLGACRKHVKLMLAAKIFDSAVRLQPRHAAAYVLMSNIYENAGLWEHSESVKELAQKAGAWKGRGLTWMKHQDEVHSFIAGDHDHHQKIQLFALLRGISIELRKCA